LVLLGRRLEAEGSEEGLGQQFPPPPLPEVLFLRFLTPFPFPFFERRFVELGGMAVEFS